MFNLKIHAKKALVYLFSLNFYDILCSVFVIVMTIFANISQFNKATNMFEKIKNTRFFISGVTFQNLI